VITAIGDIVNRDSAAIRPVVCSALLSPANVANVLIRSPKIVAVDAAIPIRALDEEATGTDPVTPAISSQCVASEQGVSVFSQGGHNLAKECHLRISTEEGIASL